MRSDIEKVLREFYNVKYDTIDDMIAEDENEKDKLIKNYENQIATLESKLNSQDRVMLDYENEIGILEDHLDIQDRMIKDYGNQIKTFQQNYKQLEEKCEKLEKQLQFKDFISAPKDSDISNVKSLIELLQRQNEELKKDLIEKEKMLKSRNDAYNKIYEENEKLKNQYKTERTVQQICLDIEKKIDKVTNSIEKTYPARPYPWQKELDPEDSWWKGKADHTIVSNTTDV